MAPATMWMTSEGTRRIYSLDHNMKRVIFYCIYSLLICTTAFAQSNDADSKTIVFVHGAWGGGWDYRNLEVMLEQRGHHVQRVSLTGLGERSHLLSGDIDLDTHIMDVVNTIKYDDLENIILVGHSYGGMVITGVAHRVPEKIKHLVYIDAMLPLDGESVISLQPPKRQEALRALVESKGNGISLPPTWPDWESTKVGPHPIGTFLQPVTLGNSAAEKLPATYVLTIEEGADEDDHSFYATRAKKHGWKYVEWKTGHNPQHTMPNEYVELLSNLE